MFLFAKKKTPAELTKEWQTEIRRQMRACDKEVRGIESAEIKVKRSIKEAAKGGQMSSARLLAKELVHSKRAKERLFVAKANLNSVSLQLGEQLATAKVVGALQGSTDIMRLMNKLVSVPQLKMDVMALGREMTKAGVMQEMTEDMFEDMEDDDIEEDVDNEITKVMTDILGEAGMVGKDLASSSAARGEEEADEEESRRKDEELLKRQEKLK
eukprot:comp19932_c0_seq2/m.38810 comp19932_c0_seq2/g.38810  ORF comp19932_c0_seq2/g.38810 comp19932_c0_seq2/m.38810 type:complete len:213 (-) comp19932_c0_seq2:5-643(-)